MKPFTTLAAVIFALVAMAHIYRLVSGCEVVLSGHSIPMWVSAVAALVAGGLAVMLWREART
ncbi:MAG: hypothetical protein QOK17_1900 [Sphingomonadales bacterium]|jgi:hypothetical protein|nr:hypothetical protein [Sphingomonadales bacterium]